MSSPSAVFLHQKLFDKLKINCGQKTFVNIGLELVICLEGPQTFSPFPYPPAAQYTLQEYLGTQIKQDSTGVILFISFFIRTMARVKASPLGRHPFCAWFVMFFSCSLLQNLTLASVIVTQKKTNLCTAQTPTAVYQHIGT